MKIMVVNGPYNSTIAIIIFRQAIAMFRCWFAIKSAIARQNINSAIATAEGSAAVTTDSRYLAKDVPSLAEAVQALKEGPFTLATEDEWEYLCNGGIQIMHLFFPPEIFLMPLRSWSTILALIVV